MQFLLLLFIVQLIWSPISAQNVRIIGGKTAFAGQFPFASAIHKITGDGTYFCGGSLLDQEWILTAGQCVDGAILFTIVLGTTDISGDDPNELRLATDNYVLHPNYDPLTLENDLALIRLRMPITYTTYISPIDYLPTADLNRYSGAVAVGWGPTDDETPGVVNDLNWVHLTVLSNEECSLTYGHQIKETMACAEGNYNEGICHGDSGGPLVQDLGTGHWMQVGVSSFVSGNGCESLDPSGFTRTFPYVDWINNVTGIYY